MREWGRAQGGRVQIGPSPSQGGREQPGWGGRCELHLFIPGIGTHPCAGDSDTIVSSSNNSNSQHL
jgi:hypothetical protein